MLIQHPRFIDLTGKTIGRLSVLHPTRKNGRLAWMCSCSCGTLPTIRSSELLDGKAKSCGCLRKDLMRIRGPEVLKNYVQNNPQLLEKMQRTQGVRLKKFRNDPANRDLYATMVADFVAFNEQRQRQYRVSLGLDPSTPISSIKEQLHTALKPLLKAIMGRDGFRCACCGTHNRALEVHHIVLRRESSFPLWMDPTNLITLCENCHKNVVHRGNFCSEPDPVWTSRLAKLAIERNCLSPVDPDLIGKVQEIFQKVLSKQKVNYA